MAVTRVGTPWVGAVGHVVKEDSYSFETATILDQHTEDEAVGDWDRVLMAVTLLGSACMNALAYVVEELNTLFVIATIPGQHT